LEKENTFIRAGDPTQIPLSSYPHRIQYAYWNIPFTQQQ
jgi:hypothetical protein